MKIAFVHYHLKPGGVTTVIREQINAVNQFGEALLISGEPSQDNFKAKELVVPGLAYDRVRQDNLSPLAIADQMSDLISQHWPNGCDLLHVHNPTLAKNRDFLQILSYLQSKNIKLLLQIHDFAEDGRPTAYFEDEYPENCHYVVINNRDFELLQSAGLKPHGVHLLPNAVTAKPLPDFRQRGIKHILYPVRAIRRKNIGEAVLLSVLGIFDLPLLITLPPNSPADFGSYEHWRNFVQKNKISISFEAGLNTPFEDLVASAQVILTTSISEGFGFSFLEPWLYEKQVWGRFLPDICTEFENQGVSLSSLYRTIQIPIDWIGRENYLKSWQRSVLKMSGIYGHPFSQKELEIAGQGILNGNSVDFGMLNEAMQTRVIDQALKDPEQKETLLGLNPALSDPCFKVPDIRLLKQNGRAVQKNFNRIRYRERLREIYRKILTGPPQQKIDKKKLLTQFLNLETFSLLK